MKITRIVFETMLLPLNRITNVNLKIENGSGALGILC